MQTYPPVGPTIGHRPQSGQNHPAQEQPDFIDGSGTLFQMYLEMAAEEDKSRTDNWKADADGILIFTGLFSAAVATLASVSVQDLKPNSQDISAFYLAKMYQLSTDSNGSQTLIPSTLADPSVPFSPPIYAVWVNSLWFLSLVISLTCALLATLLQQWARRYMRLTQKRYSLHKRAPIRAFFAEGVDKLHLPWAVEALPALLHLSLFLFFIGLAVFLFNTNHTVFKVAISWIGICTGMYACITLMPMFRHDSPYYAPLSLSAWYLYNGTLSTLFGIFVSIALLFCRISDSAYPRLPNLWWPYRRRVVRGMEKEFEETALGRSSELNSHALAWTFESLDEDHELERFFAGIPGFCDSKEVDDPQSSLAELETVGIEVLLLGFWERTLSSNLLSEPVKERRFVICVRVIDALHLSHMARAILDTCLESQHALFRSIEIGHSLTTRGDRNDREIVPFAQGIIAFIIASAPQRDERWFALTMHHLRISEHALRAYLNHGDSMLLASLIHITRHLIRNFENQVSFAVAMSILPRLSKLRGQDTLPGLQHDFCQLWNDIFLEAHARDSHRLSWILRTILPIYLALHQDTHASPNTFSAPNCHDRCRFRQASLHLQCIIPSHGLNPAFSLNEDDYGRAMEMAWAPITTSPSVPRSDADPSVIQLIANCDAPPFPTLSLDHTSPQLADEPSRNEVLVTPQRPTPASSSSHPVPLENGQFPDGAVAGLVQGIADPSLGSSMTNFVSRSTLNGDAASPGIGNTTITIPPSFNPDPVPLFTPLLTISGADPATFRVSADFTGDQLDHTPHGGLVLPSLSQIAASSLFDPRINSDFDSNPMAETGPLDVPDDTLGLDRRIMSQSPTSSSPNMAEDNLRPEDCDLSEKV